MSEQFSSQTSWAAGELSPRLWYRKDLEQNTAGAKALTNCRVWRQGGLFRRTGTKYLATLPGDGILLPFVYSSSVGYQLVLTDTLATVYRDGVSVHTFATPWSEAELADLYWTQSYDVLFVAHPNYPIQVIKRFADANWTIAAFDYRVNGNFLEQPYWKYADTNVSLNPSGTTGSITLVASEDLFDAAHVGTRFRLNNGEVTIDTVSDAQNATATVNDTLANANSTKDWEEQAFNAYRGYAGAVEIHEQRLAVGGARSVPNTLWLSESGDLYSFAPKDRTSGDVLAEHAITFTIDANPGLTVWMQSVSNRLIVGTTDGESGLEAASTAEGLGPDNFAVRNYTTWGSKKSRCAARVGKDVIHVERGGGIIRQLRYKFEDDSVDSNILSDVSEHLISEGDTLAFQSTPEQTLWLRKTDGSVTCMTYEPQQKVAAWSPMEIGNVRSIAVLPEPDGTDDVYFIVERNGSYFLEVLGEQTDDPLVTPYLDSAVYGHDDVGKTVWSGLDHLEGEAVSVWCDGFDHPPVTVTGGNITLSNPYKDVWAGLPYTHVIDFIPPNRDHLSMKAQLKRLLLYLLNTRGVRLLAEADDSAFEYPLFETVDSGLVEIAWEGRTMRDMGRIRISSNEPYPFGLTAATFIWTVNAE